MLQLHDICKSYKTGNLLQQALDNVSLTLRDNEFVAILGPSGSGKTTLLNIIGGLDHYESGDLIIDGISTKKYKDRDWDSYRNHSVGFVFQSYNLIPHQTILANVELALTISGVGKAERKRRAEDALEKVGLKEQAHKLPEQLSGGQMQRVAIARALVNDPKILLADEPTGALDSETSVQVMDLLKEVANDRLVVMVTHNPELADAYATRIIKLRDGRIRSDSNPPADSECFIPPENISHKNMGKASMSFLTALSLSFNNLKTKKARTFLTSFAGSIGIIGIALILAASAGVNDYIAAQQEAMLYAYPIEITDTSFDMMSFMTADTSDDESDEIGIRETLTKLFSTVGSNDLESLRSYIESGESDIYDLVNAIEYTYNVTPQIFLENGGEYHQVNPYNAVSSINAGIFSADANPFSSLFATDVFFQLPSNEKVYSDQYEVVSGRLPESYDECVVVLTANGDISDTVMYALGLRDSVELQDMVSEFLDGGSTDVPEDFGTYTYADIIGTNYKLVYSTDYYEYDDEYDVWVDKTDNTDYIQSLAENGETLTVVGILQSSTDSQSMLLDPGIYYTSDLTDHIIEKAADTQIVKDQLENPDTDIFTGDEFGTEADNSDVDLSSLFDIDSDMISEAFDFDTEQLEEEMSGSIDMSEYIDMDSDSVDLSGMTDMGDISVSIPDTGNESLNLSDIISGMKITVSAEDISAIASDLLSGYQEYISGIPEADLSLLAGGFRDYMSTQEARDILISNIREIIAANDNISVSGDQITALSTALMTGFQEYITQHGYTDGTLMSEYFAEFLQTDAAWNILNTWASENLQFSSDAQITQEQLQKLISELSSGYEAYAAANSLPTAESIGSYFIEYLATDGAQKIMTDGVLNMVDVQSIEKQVSSAIESYVSQMMSRYGSAISDAIQKQMASAVESVMSQITSQLTSGMEKAMSALAGSISASINNALNVDSETLLDAFGLTMDASQLTELLTSLTSSDSATYDGNLSLLGYADLNDPYGISIYPKDFESKEAVIDILNSYNSRMEASGKDEQVIAYSDTTGTLMSSVTDMVNIISAVMIAVVAISLIVSSIMISVITYISVLERKKEIGILRALGASKRNISNVFNAETIIIGLCSGLLGVIIAALLTIPINSFIRGYINMDTVHIYLPVLYGIALVAISIGLTLFSGLIPSSKAAKSDPVEALRTE
ncbi:MAG TPA: ATP-binding cassette domain-containing protein [Candidatus Alectryocaccobium stercorigallinarum]|nr:ATP-binding cassette domain-containing protein [Candidatus Alectryocaccobium stercorigallinarum]